jgi:hypothetical protein
MPKRKVTLKILPLKSECIKFHFSVDDFQQFNTNNDPMFSSTRTSIIQDSLITIAITGTEIPQQHHLSTRLYLRLGLNYHLSQQRVNNQSSGLTPQKIKIKKGYRTANLGITESTKSQHYQGKT